MLYYGSEHDCSARGSVPAGFRAYVLMLSFRLAPVPAQRRAFGEGVALTLY